MTLTLSTIIVSTRPGRVGPSLANWFHGEAEAHDGFDAKLVDLADVGLPLYDEPHHPRLQKYEHDHTKRWSEIVAGSDAFVFVTPEYNFTMPPSLVNAIDYLYSEWQYKPAGFVSYGGVSGGLRSVQTAKTLLTTLKIMPIPEQVVIPMVAGQVKDGTFTPNDPQKDSAKAMLNELARWAGALKPLRG